MLTGCFASLLVGYDDRSARGGNRWEEGELR